MGASRREPARAETEVRADPWMPRRAILFFSAVLSVLLHALLVYYADRIDFLGRFTGEAEPAWERFRVDLVEVPFPEEQPSATDERTAPVAPPTVEELLQREFSELKPELEPRKRTVEVPQLTERLAEEVLPREHNLERSLETLERIDARIVEIAAADARQDIEVPRRMVRPSPARVLSEGGTPSLRAEGGADLDLMPLPAFGGTAFGSEPSTESMDLAGLPLSPQASDFEPMTLFEPEPQLDFPGRAVEERIATAPLVEELRTENDYEFLDDLVDIEVASYIPPGEPEGYFRVRITPKKGRPIPALPKDVTFVVDASSSIIQRKLDATVKGLQNALDMLRPEDRFNVVIFRDTPRHFRSDRVPATEENKAEAIRFVQGLKSFGETNVFSAIQPVVSAPTRDGVPGVVLLVTDGRPTSGLRDARSIINTVTLENLDRNPVLAFSGGRTANRYLLDLLAYRNKGESYVSPDIGTMTRDLTAFFAQFNDPLLIDLRANYVNVDDTHVYPKELPDFFRGRAISIYGRFRPGSDRDFAMRLVGRGGDNRKELVYRADLEKAQTGDADIARNWAFRRIYYLIGVICEQGERPELLAELRRLGRQYGIQTSYDE